MNYEYGEPYLEITFHDDTVVRIKKSTITDMREDKVKENDETKYQVQVFLNRGGASTSYIFFGRMEEFDKRCKTIYI